MSGLAVLLKRLAETTNNGLGEALRALTFVGEGYGCYRNFDVTPKATPWSDDQLRIFMEYNDIALDHQARVRSRGYRYHIDSLTVDVFWCWDGDGTLYFRLWEGGELLIEVINYDCKHGNEWEETSQDC